VDYFAEFGSRDSNESPLDADEGSTAPTSPPNPKVVNRYTPPTPSNGQRDVVVRTNPHFATCLRLEPDWEGVETEDERAAAFGLRVARYQRKVR
jgi:hypothetical protein